MTSKSLPSLLSIPFDKRPEIPNKTSQYMVNEFLDKLKQICHVRFDKELSRELNISQHDVGNWRKRGVIPKQYLNIIRDKYNLELNDQLNDQLNDEGDSPVDMKYIIELQKDKIDYLQKELVEKNALINHKPKKPPETLAEISDMLTDVSKQWAWVFGHTDKPMSCTRDGILRNANPALCTLLGYSEREMIDKSLLEFIHPDDREKALIEMKKQTRNIKLRVLKSNGKYCNMNIEAEMFGSNKDRYSIALITCPDKGCPDIND